MKTKFKIFLLLLFAACLSNQKSNAQTVFAVAADKMNVLYIGLDNPVTVAVAEIPSDKISVSIDNGTITGENGKYVVNPVNPGIAALEMFTQTETGEKKSVGKEEFRVKQVPSPIATVYGKRGADVIKMGELKFIAEIVPVLDNFEFDLRFPVVSFDVSMNMEGVETTWSSFGHSLSEKQKELISKAEVGSKIYFEKVKVKKPNGEVVEIGSVSLKVI